MKYIKKFEISTSDMFQIQYMYRVDKNLLSIINKFKEFEIDFKLFKQTNDLGYEYYILFYGYHHDAYEIMNNASRIDELDDIPKGYDEVVNIEQELDMIKYNL